MCPSATRSPPAAGQACVCIQAWAGVDSINGGHLWGTYGVARGSLRALGPPGLSGAQAQDRNPAKGLPGLCFKSARAGGSGFPGPPRIQSVNWPWGCDQPTSVTAAAARSRVPPAPRHRAAGEEALSPPGFW